MNHRRIAVAIDFSEPSRHALREAGRLAERSGAQLLVLHVMEEHAVEIFAKELRGDPGVLHQAFESQLTAWIAGELPAGLPVEQRICTGSPGRDLWREAESFGADLLVAGTRGNSHPGRRLGTIAGMLTRQSRIPVLLANPDAAPIQSVVVCVDYSETSAELMEEALAIAAAEDLEIHAIHNEPSAFDYYANLALSSGLEPYTTSAVDSELVRSIDEEHAQALERFVEGYQAQASPRRIRPVLTQNLNDARGILVYLERVPNPLVVLGAHGKFGWRDAFVGTTTERVLHGCPGSALVLRSRSKLKS